MYGIIYKITNKIDGKSYIGQTSRTLSLRKAEHKYDAHKETNYPLYNAMNHYGFENFIFEEVVTAETLDELNALEQFYIEKEDTLNPNGYNLSRGGQIKKFSEESRKKMSDSKKVLLSDKTKHPNWGKSSGRAKKIVCLNNDVCYVSANKAAKDLKLDCSGIIKVCKGKYAHTKGFRFKYL